MPCPTILPCSNATTITYVPRHLAGELLERSGLLVRAGRTVAHWSGTNTVAGDGLCIGDSNGYRGRTAVRWKILCDRATGRFCQLNHLSGTKGYRIDSERAEANNSKHKNQNTATSLQSLILLILGKPADLHQNPCSSKTRSPFTSPAT